MKLLLRGLRWSYVRVAKPEKIQNLKDYFKARLVLQPATLVQALESISSTKIQFNDHRWISLLSNIEDNLKAYDLPTKLRIYKNIPAMNTSFSLCQRIDLTLMDNIQLLSFAQLADVLWCKTKMKKNQPTAFAKIFQRLCAILTKNNTISIQDVIIYLDPKSQNQYYGQLTTVISPQSVTSVLWAMSEMQIVDYVLLKVLTKKAVNASILSFNFLSRCKLLKCYLKLNRINKRIVITLYYSIRAQFNSALTMAQEVLFNLIVSISKLTKRSKFKHLEQLASQDPEQARTYKDLQLDMRQFIKWLAETLFIKYSQLIAPTQSAFLLRSFVDAEIYQVILIQQLLDIILQVIKEIKVSHLVVIVCSVCELPRQIRKPLFKKERMIFGHFWKSYHAVNQKEQLLIQQLINKQKINLNRAKLNIVEQKTVQRLRFTSKSNY